MKSLVKKLGLVQSTEKPISKDYIDQYIRLRLVSLGLSDIKADTTGSFLDIAKDLLDIYRERERIIRPALCPPDQRIQDFITEYFSDLPNCPQLQLPNNTFTLDFYGLARELSIPSKSDEYTSEYVKSYRIKQGILHNPKNDRRTTKGVFHVAEGGLPIPDDKKAVPKYTTAYLLHKALAESGDIMNIPYTASQNQPAKSWVSLLLRPIVCPEVAGITPEKTMEIRFFAPASLVGNMDFVESIFGNAGNPYNLTNNAALDIEHWTGHTGCVILAPQLTQITKKEAGLPHIGIATERQIRDGMCWEDEEEFYNDGGAFKITFRTDEGAIVTIIADNYFGYSKKEVKTQINFAANLFGNCEEEHAGGAFVFPTYNQGDMYINNPNNMASTFKDIAIDFSDIMDVKPEGYAIDKQYDNIFYVPENTIFNLANQSVSWTSSNKNEKTVIKLLPQNYYILPNGSKFRMERVPGTTNYRLVETLAEGTFFHKPCTVSGGGKSEISKPISDAIFTGSFFIKDFNKDMDFTRRVIEHDYGNRYKDPVDNLLPSRPFLSPRRSNGSVIKLLTPSPDFTDEYNGWLLSIPQYIKGIAFIVKRYYREEWGNNWHEKFSVDILNGQLGNELKYNGRKLASRYLRVGFDESGVWRTFKLRQDFVHANKIQMEDDITASTVVPTSALSKLNPLAETRPSTKLITNCEYRFFQRPDDAIHRGYDKNAESDLSRSDIFVSNYEPLTVDDAKDMLDETIAFEKFTEPMSNVIKEMAAGNAEYKYFICSANPRLVNGKPSANVRYLQTRNDLIAPRENYIADIGTRISRRILLHEPLFIPVNLVLPGRRNNRAEKGIRPLAVYNPVHYQELPELFMDFICSLTGKSPSTTGAGSEGALTKSPFNALSPIIDLNNALISYILTGYPGFTTPAGYIGSKFRVDHDLSLLIPELLARLTPDERNPQNMIEAGYLEKINDFEHNNQTVKASILGYRITPKFVNTYFGRIFENPDVVFTQEMLKPELQNIDEFADGVNNIIEAQRKVAESYFNDGSIEQACPPLKALLHIMVHGHYEGKTLEDNDIRNMFTYDYLVNSDTYANRLMLKQQYDIKLWETHIRNITKKLTNSTFLEKEIRDALALKLTTAKETLEWICSLQYIKSLHGSLGRDSIKKY